MADVLPRRGFLRGLVALPLIGGGITLIGSPTKAAVPVTQELAAAYDEWLYNERKLLKIEQLGLDCYVEMSREKLDWIPATPAGNFHWHPPGAAWNTGPQPSSRAAIVLAAVGCDWRRDEGGQS